MNPSPPKVTLTIFGVGEGLESRVKLGDGSEGVGEGLGTQIEQNMDQDVDPESVVRPFTVGHIHSPISIRNKD